MKRLSAILIGLALAAAIAGAARADENPSRSGYSYLRETGGQVVVNSRYNGRVEARRNLPISAGDEISVSEAGRADVALADGNALLVGGGTRVRFVSLHDQQGEDDQFSAVNLVEGSVVLFAGGDNEGQIPRIDTEDATVYLEPGARARVNADPRRGTVIIGRAGTAEVRTRAGTFHVKAGEFLEARGDEEPQVERGSFSRDRFDIWAADRLDSVTETRSASARYVDDRYASDVTTLDGYGDWQYNDEYGADVWSPRVDAGWTPYSDGSWYYTPAGMTWWSNDPWGWYPFHYGSWFFSSGWNRWCWRPSYVYSPAWVYWAYTPSFIGWCPIGSYSFWSPWYDNYYRHLGWFNRNNVFIGIHGVFSTRTVDFRGWNFVGANRFGAAVARMDILPGARIAGRLGSATVAVSSRPMVVSARPGQALEAVQSFVREAPRAVERSSTAADSARLAPLLARQRTLPATTLEAVQQHAVVTERGRLAGPGVAEVAPRGALVERNRTLAEIAGEPAGKADRERASAGAQPIASREARDSIERERPASASAEGRAGSRADEDWRSRPDSRLRPRGAAASLEGGAPRSEAVHGEDWRSRTDVPPARRVIEGAVPSRRVSPSDDAPRTRAWRYGDRSSAPPSREYRPDSRPREYRPESAPRAERPHAAPAPRAESHHSAPPSSRSSDHGRRDH